MPQPTFFREALARYNSECGPNRTPSKEAQTLLKETRARVESHRINASLFLHLEYNPNTVSFDMWQSPFPLNW